MKAISDLIKNSNSEENTWFNYFTSLLSEAYTQAKESADGLVGFCLEKIVDHTNNQKDLKRNEIKKQISENNAKFKNFNYKDRTINLNHFKNRKGDFTINECIFKKNNSQKYSIFCSKNTKKEKKTLSLNGIELKCTSNKPYQSLYNCFETKTYEENKQQKELVDKNDALAKEYNNIGENFKINPKYISMAIGAVYGIYKGHQEFTEKIENTPIDAKMDNYQIDFVVSLDNNPLPLSQANNMYVDFDVLNDSLQPCLLFGANNNSITISGTDGNAIKLKKLLNLDPDTDPTFVTDDNLKLLIYTSILPTISPEKTPEFYNLIANRIEETRRVAENRIAPYVPNQNLQQVNNINQGMCNIF